MASLLERMNVTPTTRGDGNGGRAGAALPYNRAHRGQNKADFDSMWQHDMYNGPGKTLSSPLIDPSLASSSPGGGGRRRIEASLVQNALSQATAAVLLLKQEVSIRGSASRNANVVEVAGLGSGNSAADGEVRFRSDGEG